MPATTRAAGVLAVLLALAAYAYAPLLRAGLLGADYAVLASLEDVAQRGDLASLYALEGGQARPAATVSLLLSLVLWTEGGRWTGAEAMALRLEHLALLFVAAWGLHGTLRRSLRPWLGQDSAKAAAHAGAALLVLHPLCVAAVARVGSRGDLMLLAVGAWSVRLFVGGRQERRHRRVAAAVGLAFLCGVLSPLAVFLPWVAAGLEYLSSRRHRTTLARLRTAFTTLVCFGVAVHLEWLGRLRFAPAGATDPIPLPGEGASFALGLEKLGVLMLPTNTYGIGKIGYLLAAVAVLLALHPGFVAARSAPRLWGRIVLGWGLSLLAVLAPQAHVRIPPGGLDGAHVLLPAALIMAVGLGISSIALSGWRRAVVPAVVGGVLAILGRAVALPQEEAAATVAGLRASLVQAARERGWRTTLVVLDPPTRVAGVDPLGDGLPALLAEPFLPAAADPGGALAVRGVDAAAFRAWIREPELAELRAAGAALLVDEGGGRRAVDLPPPGSDRDDRDRLIWRGEGRTPAGTVLDALAARAFRVTALPDADVGEPPVIRWEASREVPNEEITGAWVAGDGAPVAVFDMEASLSWLLSGRVRSTWFPGPLTSIVSAQVTPGPAPIPGEVVPRPVGDDWLFDVSSVALPAPLAGQPYWRLGILDLASLRYGEWFPDLDAGGRLRFPGAARWAEAAEGESGGPLVWTLDRRVGGVTVARASSRRGERTPSPDGDG